MCRSGSVTPTCARFECWFLCGYFVIDFGKFDCGLFIVVARDLDIVSGVLASIICDWEMAWIEINDIHEQIESMVLKC